ncbi:proliferation marker protein Ki-67 isoform X2 [Anolis sagrei]|uniref:proliferation marker protein Ki-67 isoform X2 n=1 Tax=Anolis sagrei TaxID=38937 RepID=UPI003522F88C
MPLYGKIVVIRRNGSDGTHFPLTGNSCLFGRKKECDIRIQLPEVSKEHCKIEVNENKEVTLFNLSSTTPTQLNGNIVQDPTFLKHGDILTVIDRSFRFEYPPLSPRQKRFCRSQEKETLQVLHVQQKEEDLLHPQDSENRNPQISDIKKSPQQCKNTKHDLLTQPLGKRKSVSFGVQPSPELLDKCLPPNSTRARHKMAGRRSLPLQNSPRAVLKNDLGLRQPVIKDQPQPNLMEKTALLQGHGSPAALSLACRMSPEQNRSSFLRHMITEECSIVSTDLSSTDRITHVQALDASVNGDWPQEEEDKMKQPTTNKPIQNVEAENNEPINSNASERGLENEVEVPAETVSESNMSTPLPRKSGIKKSPEKRQNTEHDLLTHVLAKRKRVSFGGQLSPELFDKRLPPNSPLKRGATPRRMSLPFGNSPRAVLKKGLGLRQSVTKEQHKTVMMKNASPKARKSPATSPKTASTSPSTQKSPATSPKAPTTALSTRRSPAATPIAHRSPSPLPPVEMSCGITQRKGRFSISHVTCPSSEEGDSITTQIHQNKDFDYVKTSEAVGVVSQADPSVRRSKKNSLKRSSMHRRSSTMDSVHSKRRSGASEANLIVAKSWAEVVKQGVPKSQAKVTRTKCDVKRSLKKKPTKQSKKKISTLRTPTRKAKGQFTTTGHANSPAPILIGKAHSSIMNLAAQVPKVIFNYPLKRQHDLNESFTGMTEMFKTPLKGDQKHSLSAQTTLSEDISEMCSPGKSGEASTTPFNITNQQSLCNENIVSLFNEMSQEACLGQDDLQMTPREANSRLKVGVRKNSLPVSVKGTPALENKNPEQKSETMVEVSKVKRNIRTPKQKTEPVETLSAVKRILKTPKPKTEPVEALSAVKRILRTPKQKTQPVEALSAVKRILKTPKQKTEPVEALSGVKRIFRTPKQKIKQTEALSGVKRLLRTPKEKPEPVEVLSGVKRIFRTPKEKPEPVEALSGIKRIFRTPKQKTEPVEALSGVKRLLKTPEQNTEPVEAFSGVKRTPKQNLEPTEVFSGIKSLLKTPKENQNLIADDIICSKLITTPELASLGSSKKEHIIQPMEKHADETPKEKVTPLEDLEEIQRQLRTPKQRPEVVQDLVGIRQLFKTPKQRFLPVDDFFGLPKLMAEPKQSSLSLEIDYTGVKEIFNASDEHKDEILETANVEEDRGLCMHSRKNSDSLENELEKKGTNLEDSTEIKFPFTTESEEHKCDFKPKDNLLNELKTEAIEIECMPKSHQEDGTESPNANKTNFLKEQTANLSSKDKEIAESLDSGRKTRKRKSDESNTTPKQKGKMQKLTRSAQRAKSDRSEKNNSNVEQSIYESSKHSIETDCNIQNKEIEPSEMESTRNRICLRNAREKATPIKTENEILNTVINENKSGSTKYVASKLYKTEALENNTEEVEENAIRGKGKKVRFLLEKNNSMFLEDKCVLGDNDGIPEEEMSAFSKKLTSPAKENTSRRSKIKASVVSQQLCFSLSEGKHAFETCRDKDKKDIKLSFESSTLTKEDPSVISSSFSHGKNVQEMQVEESPNETQKVPLESISSPVVHSPLKKQDVAKGNPPRRGRSRGNISHEVCAEHDSEQSADMKKQNITKEENQPMRGRRTAPAFKIPLPVEDIVLVKENPKTDSINSPERECSLLQIHNETQKESVESMETPTEEHPTRKQKVAKENPPRRGRNKNAICHDTSTEHDSRKATEVIDYDRGGTVNENQQKRTRRRGAVPVVQEDSLPTADSIAMQQIQIGETPLESQMVPSETVQTLGDHSPSRSQVEAKESLPRRGRRKAISQETLTEYVSKEAAEKDHNLAVSIDNNRPKRGRGKRVVLKEDTAFSEESHKTDSFNSVQNECSLKQTQNDANAYGTQGMPVENVEVPAEHSPSKRFKIAKEDPPKRGKKKVIDEKALAECETKEAAIVDENTVAKNAPSTKMNEPKKGRGRKIAPVSFFSPLENNSLILSPSIKRKTAIEQGSSVLETVTAVDSGTLSRRGRRRKVDNINATSSAPVLLDKDKEEKICKDIPVENLSQELCFTLSEGKRTFETCRDKEKEGIKLSFENSTLTKEHPSVVSAGFSPRKNVQEIQVEESPNETQKVSLESISSPVVHSPLKRQDVAKESPPRRGRSRRNISHDSKQSADMKKQNVTKEENQPKRGRTAPTFKMPLPVEDIVLVKENPKTDRISSVERECSLLQIHNETQKESVESMETLTEEHPARKQKVAKENPTRRGRNKNAISHDTSTEHDSRKATEVIDYDRGGTVNENQQKRTRRRGAVPVVQEDSLPTAEPIALQQIQIGETPLESQMVPSETVQTLGDHSPSSSQVEAKVSLPRRGRRKAISQETLTEHVSKEAAEKDHNLAISIDNNRPKRGRGKRVVLKEDTAFSEESHKTDSFNSAQNECSLKQTQNDANAYGTQGMPVENVEVPAEHSPSKRFKIAKEDPPKRGKKKVIDEKALTEHETKEAAVTKDENTVAKNAPSTKKGRGRKIAPVSLFSPLENNSLILSPSIKSKAAIEQGIGVLETAATVDSETLSRRGRRRKVDNINTTSSAPVLLDKDKEEKICKVLPEENVSKRGRRKQLVLCETLTVNNSQLGNSGNTGSGKDKPVHLETGFEKKNQSKRKREERNVLSPDELLPSLKVSITLPSSEKDQTANENVGKNKRTKSCRNKNEIVEFTTSVRRNNKATQEVFQEKDLKKKKIVNEKQYRRGRKKADAFESAVCVSLKEKDDQQEVLNNTAPSKKVTCRRGQTFHKGNTLQKDTDQRNNSQNDQNNSSELPAQVAKKNSSRTGRRKEVKNDSETSTNILDVSEGFVTESKSTRSKKEKAKNTTLKKKKGN